MSFEEKPKVIIEEVTVLEKFEGDPIPENLFERIHIKNGEIVHVEKIKEPDENLQ